MILIIVYTLVLHLTVTLGTEHCANEVIQMCESLWWKNKSCHIPGAEKVTHVSVSSVNGGRCTKHKTFGISNDKIWVSGGCRAYFKVCYEKGHCPHKVIRKCESWWWKYKECHISNRAVVTSVAVHDKKGGRCDKGGTFGMKGNKIWVNKSCRANFIVCYEFPGRKVRYDIKVQTGNMKYAGTDADVTIQVLGERGSTEKFLLDDKKDNFEVGMTDNFILQAFDVGPIYEIKIGHDNKGSGPGWFLDEVTISKYLAKEEVLERTKNDLASRYQIPLYDVYHFTCKRWLAKDEDDGLLMRTFTPDSTKTYFEGPLD